MDLWEFNGNLMGNVWELYGMNIEHSTKNMPLKNKKWIQLVVIHNSLGGHVCIYIYMYVCVQPTKTVISQSFAKNTWVFSASKSARKWRSLMQEEHR